MPARSPRVLPPSSLDTSFDSSRSPRGGAECAPSACKVHHSFHPNARGFRTRWAVVSSPQVTT